MTRARGLPPSPAKVTRAKTAIAAAAGFGGRLLLVGTGATACFILLAGVASATENPLFHRLLVGAALTWQIAWVSRAYTA